jgi:hypothetical protein
MLKRIMMFYIERCEKLREAFRERLLSLKKWDCVYVDESGIDAFLSRKRGRTAAVARKFSETFQDVVLRAKALWPLSVDAASWPP